MGSPGFEAAVVAGLLVVPLAGYFWAIRRPGITRIKVVATAAGGGAVVGAIIVISGLMSKWSHGPSTMLATLPVLLPYLGLSALNGAVIGVLGLLARSVGGWLSGRA